MRYLIWVAIVFVSINSRAQSGANPPHFEVASIRPVANDATGDEERASRLLRTVVRDGRQPGEIPMVGRDRIRLKDWTILDLTAAAFGVRPTQISGPYWIDEQGFDVEATVPVGTPEEALNGMLQTLLEERFGLKAHRVVKTGRGYALLVGKGGPTMTQATTPPAAQSTQKPTQKDLEAKALKNLDAMTTQMKERSSLSGIPCAIGCETWPSVTTDELAARLVSYTKAPVVNATGLSGKYSVTIEVSSSGDGPGNTIFDAVERLGLKLEPRKVTMQTVVIDQISKMPVAN